MLGSEALEFFWEVLPAGLVLEGEGQGRGEVVDSLCARLSNYQSELLAPAF